MRPLFLKRSQLLRLLREYDPALHRLLTFCLKLQDVVPDMAESDSSDSEEDSEEEEEEEDPGYGQVRLPPDEVVYGIVDRLTSVLKSDKTAAHYKAHAAALFDPLGFGGDKRQAASGGMAIDVREGNRR